MIPYLGGPITPERAAVAAWTNRHAMISYAYPEQVATAVSVARTVVLDNGAFSAWKAGKQTDWAGFYAWAADWLRHPAVEWAIIPDVIDGNEADNDALLGEWPHGKSKGVPVWHLHESLERLERFTSEWPRIALGSSGQWSLPGRADWWKRMDEVLRIICDGDGLPRVKFHGLRMLAPDLLRQIPFSSADSTSLARNIGIDGAWKGTYLPPNKETRALVLAARMDAFPKAQRWSGAAQLECLR